VALTASLAAARERAEGLAKELAEVRAVPVLRPTLRVLAEPHAPRRPGRTAATAALAWACTAPFWVGLRV
jgi:hypothetical protein